MYGSSGKHAGNTTGEVWLKAARKSNLEESHTGCKHDTATVRIKGGVQLKVIRKSNLEESCARCKRVKNSYAQRAGCAEGCVRVHSS